MPNNYKWKVEYETQTRFFHTRAEARREAYEVREAHQYAEVIGPITHLRVSRATPEDLAMLARVCGHGDSPRRLPRRTDRTGETSDVK